MNGILAYICQIVKCFLIIDYSKEIITISEAFKMYGVVKCLLVSNSENKHSPRYITVGLIFQPKLGTRGFII